MKARELLRILRDHGCEEVRQEGSHIIIRCGKCQSVVAVHTGKDIPKGTLGDIKRKLAPCLGKDWLK
jgi:predicted RNA binding protein YcfA (HicA-like mRNA interferase family)